MPILHLSEVQRTLPTPVMEVLLLRHVCSAHKHTCDTCAYHAGRSRSRSKAREKGKKDKKDKKARKGEGDHAGS